jgi:hypothetical protein
MFLAKIEDGNITQVKVRQFLSELKDYIEESNEWGNALKGSLLVE